MNHNNIFENTLTLFNKHFEKYINDNYSEDHNLSKAMIYAVTGSGKKVRPLLTLLTHMAFDKSHAEDAIPAAIAIEFIHCYSLAHDDLPCMDDDDLRRGRPTVHKVFGDAEALLAGDALLTDAFHIIAHCQNSLNDTQRLWQISELSLAAGSKGMVLGQSKDLYWTAKQGGTKTDIDHIHLAKTGALMGAACAMGAIAGGASKEDVLKFRNFGRSIGLAFQIFDDLLDNTDATGKSKGSDIEQGKLTYLSFMDTNEARKNAEELTNTAIASLKSTGTQVDLLIQYCQQLLQRKY